MIITRIRATTAFNLRLSFDSSEGPASIEISPDSARAAVIDLRKKIRELDVSLGNAVLELGGGTFKIDAQSARAVRDVLSEGVANIESDRETLDKLRRAAAEQEQQRRRAAGYAPKSEVMRVNRREEDQEITGSDYAFRY